LSQLRLNPLTGRWVTIAADRSLRPVDFAPRRLPVEADPGRACPFCPGHEETTPPALETYGPDGHWQVRVVPNLYPAFAGDEPMWVSHLGPVFTQATASGIHEVLVLCPQHNYGWADLDDPGAGLVMAALRDRLEEHARHQNVRATLPIVNHGREAGASLAHPHGQLLGVPFVPGDLAEERSGFVRFEGSCLLCTIVDAESASGHRVLVDDDRVLAVCPYWSGTPYEMLIVPKEHEPQLQRAAPRDLSAVGRAIRLALDRLRHVVGDVAYNLVFHTGPHHQLDDQFHWHVHVVPRLTTTTGFEQGTGVLINIVTPEAATEHMNSVG
jgi:UDPglucose--hexose-1-phosphate uridylyltransferase